MVSNSRASLGARDLRPLNAPIPISVQAGAGGKPIAVQRQGWSKPCSVANVQDRWRIDDEWWRSNPISRLYYVLLLEDETLITLYHDLISHGWFEQEP